MNRIRCAATGWLLTSCLLATAKSQSAPPSQEPDPALEPPPLVFNPGSKYAAENRKWQGVPGIERAANGRLWAVWYSGGDDEGPENFVLLVTSADDGKTWSTPKLAVDPHDPMRAYDPCLWHDPTGRLWLFWAQSYDLWDGRSGVWAIVTENPGDENPRWSAPRRLCNGIMMNKPTVLKTGEWLLPASVWPEFRESFPKQHRHDVPAECGANVYASTDSGTNWTFRGQGIVPERVFDEHMLVERRDGSLWMLARAAYGIGECSSDDGGKTWSKGRRADIPHVNSRFFIRRLNSGNLLVVAHNPPDKKARSHLVARMSTDDGKTWQGGLMIDERLGVSYPDGVQAPDGTILLIYDRNRTTDREILLARFTEKDVLNGRFESANSAQRLIVQKPSQAAKGRE